MMIRNWSEIIDRPLLPVGECQLWLAWLDEEDPESFRGLLSGDERLRAGRLRSPLSANRFIVARGILRTLLGRYWSHMPDRLVFSYGPQGKPELAGNLQPGLSFNLSHSGSLAVFGIASGFAVGVDIEEIHPVNDLEATASIFLSPDELAEFEASPADGKLECFFTMWTCKEATLKARGTGFAGLDKNILVKSFSPHHSGKGKNANISNERLISFIPAEGFKGALVCL